MAVLIVGNFCSLCNISFFELRSDEANQTPTESCWLTHMYDAIIVFHFIYWLNVISIPTDVYLTF